MGCGQSKINIYPRKSKGKHSSKKSGGSSSSDHSHNGDGTNLEDEGNGNNMTIGDVENDGENSDSSVDDGSDAAKLKLKSLAGGPLSAHTEISDSQLNFFKMLDEKIESGKDYDSSSETEQIKENERLNSLLQDWETASSTSRSLPTTPRHRITTQQQQQSNLMAKQQTPQLHHHITQSIIHQSYGVTPKSSLHHTYHHNQPPNNSHNGIYPPNLHDPSFQSHTPPTYSPHLIASQSPVVNFPKAIPSNIQYQEIKSSIPTPNTTQIRQNLTNFVVQRQYQMTQQQRGDVSVLYSSLPVQSSSSPVHNIAKQTSSQFIPQTATCSPRVPLNSSPIHYKTQMITPNVRNAAMTTFLSNGVELSIQQQVYNTSQPQVQQYQQQTKEIEQYKYTREQLLLQQQQQQQILMSTNKPTGRVVGNHSSYQSPLPQQQQQQLQQQQQQAPIRAIATMSPPTARHPLPTIDKVVYKKTRSSQPQQQQYSSHEMT